MDSEEQRSQKQIKVPGEPVNPPGLSKVPISLAEIKNGGDQNQATSIKFPHFDVAKKEASDFHYVKRAKNSKHFDDATSSVSLTIMKEWRILQKSLPESIYVHAYETRIDLVRAVIIGSPGTPYHDGLFFFDICLPYDYPNQPPRVHYHSHGYRLNPNLYANGKVCLSLINTWSGSKIEKWRKESTILQILVSIQGLVLNERPYFNEPGYEVGINSKSPRWLNPANAYTEDAFILSCQSMVHIMNKPPKGFEAFVVQHFKERAASILAAVKAYEEGRVVVGQYRTNVASPSAPVVNVSSRFKANLQKVHFNLKQAFAKLTSEPKVDRPQESMNGSVRKAMNTRKEQKGASRTAKKAKKGSTVNQQANVQGQKTGILGKLKDFIKGIFQS